MPETIVHTIVYSGWAGPFGNYQVACSCGRTCVHADDSCAWATFVEHLGYTAWPIV